METKKAIYINCWYDPWIKVAETIQDKYGIKPAYWVGYQEEQKEDLIRDSFNDVIYHSDHDAWCGRFPEQIESHYSDYCIDIDFLREISQYELIALKMMDRVDPTLHTFSFPERQRHIRNLFRKWMCCLDIVKPEFVVTPVAPHRVYDFALYVVCRYHKIPFVIFDHTPFDGRCILLNDFYSIDSLFKEDYIKYLNKKNLSVEVEEDILKSFENNKKDYNEARPWYEKELRAIDKDWDSTFKIIRNTLRRLISVRHKLWGKDGRLKNWVYGPYYKQNTNTSMENSYNTLPAYLSHAIKGLHYVKELKRTYESLTVKPNYNEKYVILFLHYQPEATTCPIGNIFVDQELCVDVLLNHLPKEYNVYIKEHPGQFYANSEGQLGRINGFYYDVSKKPRVKLMSTNVVSFDLMEHCQAIVTVSGTVGWEGIVRRKPIIAFGMTWYENYDKGVLRITDEKSAEYIYSFIKSYKYDEHSLMAYLASVSKNTIKAYFYKAVHKDKQLSSEEECVENLTKAIMSRVN